MAGRKRLRINKTNHQTAYPTITANMATGARAIDIRINRSWPVKGPPEKSTAIASMKATRVVIAPAVRAMMRLGAMLDMLSLTKTKM